MDTCVICLEPLVEDLYTLNCEHVYHRTCISEWLIRSTTCPQCRRNVRPDQRYVDDGIIDEDRLKTLILVGAATVEYIFPAMVGWTDILDRALSDPRGQQLLHEFINNQDGTRALTQGISAFLHYFFNPSNFQGNENQHSA